MTLRAAVLVGALLAALSTPALADIDVTVELGHGGRWIDQATTPVEVVLRNSGTEPVAVTLRLTEANLVAAGDMRHARQVLVGASVIRRTTFLVPGPQMSASLSLTIETSPTVTIHHGGRSFDRGRTTISVEADSGVDGGTVAYAARAVGVVRDRKGVLTSRLEQATLSTSIGYGTVLGEVHGLAVAEDVLAHAPFSLDGLDSLVVVDPDPTFLEDPAHRDAVLDWVALGGVLVVSPGGNAGSLIAGPLAPYLPARVGDTATRSATAVLRDACSFAGEKAEKSAPGVPIPWYPLVPVEAEPLLAPKTAAGPLFVDRAFGNGRIRVLAFDARAALSVAQERAHVGGVAAIVSGRPSPLVETPREHLETQFDWNHQQVNVDDVVRDSLRSGAFEPPALLLVLLCLGLYVVVVGPLDWFVLKRLKKQRLTTVTFAIAVAGFTTLAYGASFLVFSSGSIVNRMVIVDLASGGRDGRELMRIQDLAGFYSPHGADRTLTYDLPAVLGEPSFPGGMDIGDVGTTLPIQITGPDATTPEAYVQVAFRSQRVVRTALAGPTGRTVGIEVEARPDAAPVIRVDNGLPTALYDVTILLPDLGGAIQLGTIESGGRAEGNADDDGGSAPGRSWHRGLQVTLPSGHTQQEAYGFLAYLTRSSRSGIDGRRRKSQRRSHLDLIREVALDKGGIGLGGALRDGRAILLARATRAPVALPGDTDEGLTTVIVRKEFDLQ